MRTISLKMGENILEQIDTHMRKHHFSTRTEFIREAIRDKLRQLENQHFEAELRSFFKENKDELKQEVAGAGRDVFKELEHRFGK